MIIRGILSPYHGRSYRQSYDIVEDVYSKLFDAMWARFEKEMAEGFPTTPIMVTARIWKARSRMHQLVTCLAHSVDNEGANTEFRAWRAHLSSPAAAPGRTSSQGA